MSSSQRSLVLAYDAKRLFNNFTGLGNYARTLLKNLYRYYPENEYHLFTPKVIKNKETAFFLDNPAFSIHTPTGFSPLWRSYGMSADINTLQPDLFHGLSHEIPFGINHNIPQVTTFHDLIYKKFSSQFRWVDSTLYQWKYGSSAKRSNHILAISKSTKKDLIEYYHIPESKVSVIYQSCNDTFQNAPFQIFSEENPLKALSPYYLYVGSIIERKGLIQIVIAYSNLPVNYRKPCVVVGNGDKKYIKKVKDLIHYYNLEKDFHFISGVMNHDLILLYDHCFALIYPSIYEGFGIPIIECAFRQKPIITSETSSMPEAAGDGAILIDPYRPESITKAMISLHDKDLYQQLQTNGKQFASKNFSSEKTSQSLMNLYRKIIDNLDKSGLS